MKYVLDEEAGSNPRVWYQGVKLDCGKDGELLDQRKVKDLSHSRHGRAKVLADFFADAKELVPDISTPEVAGIRLYTTVACAQTQA